MKDFLQFLILLAIVLGLIAAVPIVGIVVGVGIGVWILWQGWKEEQRYDRPE